MPLFLLPPHETVSRDGFFFPHVLEMHCVTLVFSYIYTINQLPRSWFIF